MAFERKKRRIFDLEAAELEAAAAREAERLAAEHQRALAALIVKKREEREALERLRQTELDSSLNDLFGLPGQSAPTQPQQSDDAVLDAAFAGLPGRAATTWCRGDGQEVNIVDMDDGHFRNVLRWLIRKLGERSYPTVLRWHRSRWGSDWRTTTNDARRSLDRRVQAFVEVGDELRPARVSRLLMWLYPEICLEANRRGMAYSELISRWLQSVPVEPVEVTQPCDALPGGAVYFHELAEAERELEEIETRRARNRQRRPPSTVNNSDNARSIRRQAFERFADESTAAIRVYFENGHWWVSVDRDGDVTVYNVTDVELFSGIMIFGFVET